MSREACPGAVVTPPSSRTWSWETLGRRTSGHARSGSSCSTPSSDAERVARPAPAGPGPCGSSSGPAAGRGRRARASRSAPTPARRAPDGGEYGATRVLLIGVLRVVEPGQAARARLTCHFQLTSSGTTWPTVRDSLLDPGAGLGEGGARRGSGPRSGCRAGRSPWRAPRRRGARAPCGAAGQGQQLVPRACARRGRGRPARTSARCGVVGARRPRVPLQRAEVGHPHQGGGLVDDHVGLRLARRRRPGCPSAAATSGAWSGTLLVPEARPAGAVGVAVHVQRAGP